LIFRPYFPDISKNDIFALLKTITYRAIKTTGTLIVIIMPAPNLCNLCICTRK
jgi:hypothetical protein